MANVVSREVPRPKPEGPQALRVLAAHYIILNNEILKSNSSIL